jgi:hypothetical protein
MDLEKQLIAKQTNMNKLSLKIKANLLGLKSPLGQKNTVRKNWITQKFLQLWTNKKTKKGNKKSYVLTKCFCVSKFSKPTLVEKSNTKIKSSSISESQTPEVFFTKKQKKYMKS